MTTDRGDQRRRAHRSVLTVSFDAGNPTGRHGAAPEHPASRLADDGFTDATDPILTELRRRVVDPVIGSLFTPDELDEVTVAWGALPDGGEVWVRVVARGELSEHLLLSSGADLTDPAVLRDAAANLADQLEDFVCESRFGWAQQRIAHYELPAD